jgi:hypothetical protein
MNAGNKKEILYGDELCKSKTITESESENLQPSGRYGPLIARIPVIISQSKVHINVESSINFEDCIIDIRSCTRHIHMTRCQLLDAGNRRTGKVYLSGYIKESIEFAAVRNIKGKCIHGDMCFKVVKIPFECAAKIDYCTRPIIKSNNRFISVNLTDIEKAAEESYITQANHVHQNVGACFERMFFDLEDTSIIESHEVNKNIIPENEVIINTCNTVTKHLTISITFSLLQWQSVSIPSFSNFHHI